MSDTFNEEDMRIEAILNFTSRRKEKIENSSKEEDNKTKEDISRIEMQSKLNAAKMHALKEISAYKDILENAREEIEKLCLFQSVGDTLYNIGLFGILESTIEPIIKGNRPLHIPEELFKEMRRDIYKTLMNRYIDKE